MRLTRTVYLLAGLAACAGPPPVTPPAQSPGDASWQVAPPSQPMDSRLAEGRWQTQAGELVLTIGGREVAGEWITASSKGLLEGTIDGTVLELDWIHGRARGSGYIEFTADGRAFYGRWWSQDGQRGEWSGWRPSAGSAGASSPGPVPTPAAGGKPTGAGTCFAASPDGLLVTAAHVVNGARSIEIIFPGEEIRHAATVVELDDEVDLAVLKAARPTAHYLSLATRMPKLGEQIFTIGFPYTFDLGAEPKFTEGVLASRSVAGVKGLFQVSMPVQPGNSGGPLVDHSGAVIGVVFARADDLKFLERTGSLPQNVAFAVAAGFLRPLLPEVTARPPAAGRQQAIDRAEPAVCTVLVR